MADPIPESQRAMMNALAEGIDAVFNGERKPEMEPKIGFVLLSFEFGKMEGGRVNYISNARREDMIVAMKELLGRWEGRVVEDASGRHQ